MENMIVYCNTFALATFSQAVQILRPSAIEAFNLTIICIVAPVKQVDTEIWFELLPNFPTKYGELSMQRARSTTEWAITPDEIPRSSLDFKIYHAVFDQLYNPV